MRVVDPVRLEGWGMLSLVAHFAYGGAPSAHVRLAVLVTGVQTGALAYLADALELVMCALYLAGVRRLARRGRSWPVTSTLAFVSGVAVVWIAVGSGLAAYDVVNVTAHVVQHVLLMMVAPPLVAVAKPVTLAIQATGRTTQRRILRVVHSGPVAVLTFPVVAWALYYGTMYVDFTTSAYAYSIEHPLFHDATHLWFFAVGYLFWHPLVGLDPARWRWPYPVRIGMLFIGMPFEAFLGIGISQLAKPLAPINSLANTHSGGDTFWILSMLATGICLFIMVIGWFRQIDRETARSDRRSERQLVENQAQAHALGIDVEPGFTVPWWRIAEMQDRARTPPDRPEPGGSR